jgi:predicted methyltransferase
MMKKIFLSIVVLMITSFSLTPAYSNDLELMLKAVLNSDHRSSTNKDRDKFRNPKETLKFFGLSNNTNVMEISPGRGWYTEIIAPVVKEKGTFNSVIYEIKANSKPYFKKLNEFYRTKLQKRPDMYEKVNLIAVNPKKPLYELNKKMDMVLTFRNVHNWAKAKSALPMFEFFFDSLKSGGILGVVEHRAIEGTPIDEQIRSGYMTEKYVMDIAKKVGFQFSSSSNINDNPKDKKNYTGGVWTLLPNLRGVKETQKKEYSQIGESDRMTLKFIKP